MKKIILYSFASILAFSFVPNQAQAVSASVKTELPADSIPSQVSLENRLKEIDSMDISELSRSEKKALRKEVRSIDKMMHDHYGGVYISIGGALLIILLLIILL
jgi:hypothetical protein